MKYFAFLLALIGAASAVYVTPFGYSSYGAYPYAASVYSAPIVSSYSAPLVSGYHAPIVSAYGGYGAYPYSAGYVSPFGYDLWKKKKAA